MGVLNSLGKPVINFIGLFRLRVKTFPVGIMERRVLNRMKETFRINGVFCPGMAENNRLELGDLLNRKVILDRQSAKHDFNEAESILVIMEFLDFLEKSARHARCAH
jgi:hypothetical protein